MKRVASIVALLVVGVLSLTACEAPKQKLGEGAVTTTPIGYYILCDKQPESEACQKN